MLADGKCELFINTWGPSVTAYWYAIWQASAALLAMCVRRQMTGRSNVRGKELPVVFEVEMS